MVKLREHLQIDVDGDVYATRIRGATRQLLMNRGYEGVQIVDCVLGSNVGEIQFPDDDCAIYSWLVSPDGSRSYVFPPEDEMDYALLLDHDRLQAAKITLPTGFEAPTELGWFTDTGIHVLDYHYVVWSISHSELTKASKDVADAVYSTPFRRITKRYAVQKMEPRGKGAYVRSREYPVRSLGFIGFQEEDEERLIVDEQERAVDLTHHEHTLFAAFEFEIASYRDGVRTSLLKAGNDELFVGIHTVADEGGAYLVVVSSSREHLTGASARLGIYALSE